MLPIMPLSDADENIMKEQLQFQIFLNPTGYAGDAQNTGETRAEGRRRNITT